MTVHTYVGSGAQVYAFNTKAAPFDDVRVRQALVMAIDRKKMSQAITNGLSIPASNPYGEGSWVKCRDDGALPTDIEKAKALLYLDMKERQHSVRNHSGELYDSTR
jgi:4-phytase/acid phosphatase/peptide/nickel transport system substrate-binding protein